MGNQKPSISATCAAMMMREMLWHRREFCSDNEFFKMVDYWDWLAKELPEISIKKFVARGRAELKAGVVCFNNRSTLIVPTEMLKKSGEGEKLSNFTLAHEFAHIALDHHAKGAVVKHFQLINTSTGVANVPPNIEELEANFAAVFFQIGVALLAPNADPIALANRANTDVTYTRKAIAICSLPEFQREFSKLQHSIERVIL